MFRISLRAMADELTKIADYMQMLNKSRNLLAKEVGQAVEHGAPGKFMQRFVPAPKGLMKPPPLPTAAQRGAKLVADPSKRLGLQTAHEAYHAGDVAMASKGLAEGASMTPQELLAARGRGIPTANLQRTAQHYQGLATRQALPLPSRFMTQSL